MFLAIESTGDNQIYYSVRYGGFQVTINDQEKFVKQGMITIRFTFSAYSTLNLDEHFFIPPQNEYGIKNIGKRRGEVSFMLLKNRPMLSLEDGDDSVPDNNIIPGINSIYQAASEKSSDVDEGEISEEEEDEV